MRTAAFVAALVAGVAAAPQAVTAAIAPQETTPAGCKTSFAGKFQVTVEPLSSKKKRDSVPLEITLKDGILTDAQGRTGYIASNNQFQFDGPAQAGAIYTAGWSVCSNGSLALGNSAIFYQCLSGTFYNLYDENTAAQCSPVFLYALSDAATTGAQAVASDGQVTGASATTGVAHTVICQIGDGQIQQNTCITTATPVAEATDGQITAPKATGPAITQISDGQIQAPGTTSSAPAVTPPVIAAPTGNTISQISDGQIQVPTGSNSTIATRTPSASTTGAVGTSAAASGSSPASTFTGAAAPTLRAELFGLVAGIAALAAL